MPSTEPYTARELHDYLVERGGRPVSQSGSHVTLVMPDGAEVGCSQPAGRQQVVGTVLAQRIARTLGMTLGELRAELGHHPTPRRPKPSANRERRLKPSSAEVEMLTRLQRAAGICADVGVLPAQREHLRRTLPSLLAELERIAAVPR